MGEKTIDTASRTASQRPGLPSTAIFFGDHHFLYFNCLFGICM